MHWYIGLCICLGTLFYISMLAYGMLHRYVGLPLLVCCIRMYLLRLPCFALVYWPMYLLRYAVLHKYVGLWYVAQVCWPAAFGMLHTNVALNRFVVCSTS